MIIFLASSKYCKKIPSFKSNFAVNIFPKVIQIKIFFSNLIKLRFSELNYAKSALSKKKKLHSRIHGWHYSCSVPSQKFHLTNPCTRIPFSQIRPVVRAKIVGDSVIDPTFQALDKILIWCDKREKKNYFLWQDSALSFF